jgi:hypothetical protein
MHPVILLSVVFWKHRVLFSAPCLSRAIRLATNCSTIWYVDFFLWSTNLCLQLLFPWVFLHVIIWVEQTECTMFIIIYAGKATSLGLVIVVLSWTVSTSTIAIIILARCVISYGVFAIICSNCDAFLIPIYMILLPTSGSYITCFIIHWTQKSIIGSEDFWTCHSL